MLTTVSGKLRVVICDAGFARSSSPTVPDQHDHDHEQHQHGGDQSPTVGENCPFALAAVHAPPPHRLAGFATAVPEFRFVSRYAEQLPPTTGPPRQTSARAPPVSARSSIV
jgi:hypothetical protein